MMKSASVVQCHFECLLNVVLTRSVQEVMLKLQDFDTKVTNHFIME